MPCLKDIIAIAASGASSSQLDWPGVTSAIFLEYCIKDYGYA